jgi:predicted enzyme related to lactoylglutathione lyase
MPTTDIARSSDFHKRVFGWNIRKRGNGSTWFDDTTGEWKIPPISAKSGN